MQSVHSMALSVASLQIVAIAANIDINDSLPYK